MDQAISKASGWLTVVQAYRPPLMAEQDHRRAGCLSPTISRIATDVNAFLDAVPPGQKRPISAHPPPSCKP